MPSDALKLSVVAAAFSPDPRVSPALARRAGFDGVQFDARTAALDVTELSGTGLREFVGMLSGHAQQLVGLRTDLGLKGFGVGADVDRELSRLFRVMETATALGAPLVCVDIGLLPVPVEIVPPKPKVTSELAGFILLPESSGGEGAKPQAASTAAPPDPAFVSQVDAALVELGKRADRTSTMIAFRAELSPLIALERALRAADCPWYGVDLDPAAVLADVWDLDETFSRLGALVRHVRGRDAIAGAAGRTKPAPIGQGGTDWTALLSNLRDADYRGWITVDPIDLPDRAAGATAAVRHLRGLL